MFKPLTRSLGILLILATLAQSAPRAHAATLVLTEADYQDRIQAAWLGQMIACMLGWQFEHQVAAVKWVDQFPKHYSVGPIDDDWYYEMCAIRGFERFGINMTVQQLGQQWLDNRCGSWGSSEQARLMLERGIQPPDTGHPRYNKLWFSIGPQFSADVYGLLAPGQPNRAAQMARTYGHLNGYAEGVDGAVFMAGMISLAFVEKDPHEVVRQAARLIHPSSPYRQCLDLVIRLAEQGKSAREIANAVEDRWHLEYPATNNAVPNGALVAISVWFGEGDFLKTVNLAFAAADFTDADCNAANAAAVVCAMHGMKALPPGLVAPIHDRIVGSEMGGVKLLPPVDEKISDLARRTAAIGKAMLLASGAKSTEGRLSIPRQKVATQPAELFALADFMLYWNPEWKLERAGFGGAGGGMGGIRGITCLDGDTLATYPRDEVRGTLIRRSVKLSAKPALTLDIGVDAGRAWDFEVYADNQRLLHRTLEAPATPKERHWESVRVELANFAGKNVELRLYQRVLLGNKTAGNAYWKNLRVE